LNQTKSQIDKISVNNIQICQNCDLKFICAGGCLMRNLRVNEKMDIPVCNDKWKKQMYNDLIKQGHVSVS